MCTLSVDDYLRDVEVEFGTDDMSEIEQMIRFWHVEGTRDAALMIADRNRERSQKRERA